MEVLYQEKNQRWITNVDDSATVSYLKALSIVVTKENIYKLLLGLHIRQKFWIGNFITWIRILASEIHNLFDIFEIVAVSINFRMYADVYYSDIV